LYSGLRELDRVDGRNIAIEYRWADGRTERYREIAEEFVRINVDVIIVVGDIGHPRRKAGDVSNSDRLCGRERSSWYWSSLVWGVPAAMPPCWQAASTFAGGCSRSPDIGNLSEC
jgi:hypothetical protein